MKEKEMNDESLLDIRALQLIKELRDALEEEWGKNHAAFCMDKFPHIGPCKYERIPELIKWDEQGLKCAYCGAARDSNKPWKIYCSQKCNAAAWRKRERAKRDAMLEAQEV